MGTIFVDLDGTIVDVSDRFWTLHCRLTHELGGSELDREQYWSLKRAGKGIADLWPASSARVIEQYRSLWLARIESPELLALDRPIVGAIDTLRGLGTTHRIVMATMRQNRDALMVQLEALGLLRLVDEVLRVPRNGAGKHELIGQDLQWEPDTSMIVGDTETDIAAGRTLGMRSVGVLSGLRDRVTLQREGADHILESIVLLRSLLTRQSEIET